MPRNLPDPENSRSLFSLEGSVHTDTFRRFVRREIRLWEEIYLDFITVGSELLVIHYENFKEDKIGEVKRMAKFLGLEMTPVREYCTATHPGPAGKARKRPAAFKATGPFDDEMHELIESAMDRVDMALASRGLGRLPVEKYRWARRKRK